MNNALFNAHHVQELFAIHAKEIELIPLLVTAHLELMMIKFLQTVKTVQQGVLSAQISDQIIAQNAKLITFFLQQRALKKGHNNARVRAKPAITLWVHVTLA